MSCCTNREPLRQEPPSNTGLYLAVFAMIVAVAASLAGCPKLPAPSGCTPGTYDCHNNQPRVCSPDQRDTLIGDQPCSAIGAVCVTDGGIAYCGRTR